MEKVKEVKANKTYNLDLVNKITSMKRIGIEDNQSLNKLIATNNEINKILIRFRTKFKNK